MPLIIAFLGQVGSGRTTAASFLPNRRILTFTEHIVYTAMQDFKFTWHQCTDPALKEEVDERWGLSPQQVLQSLDSHHRTLCPDYVFRRMKIALNEATKKEDSVVVIKDVTTVEEADYVHSIGGVVVHVVNRAAEKASLPDSVIDYRVVNHNRNNPWRFAHAIHTLYRFLDGRSHWEEVPHPDVKVVSQREKQ
jgi:hypothetical protein